MITVEKLTSLLTNFGFTESDKVYKKTYTNGASIEVNLKTQKITYAPLDNNFQNGEYPTKENPAKGFVIHRDTTLDFKAKENFVCLVCVHLLLEKGYEAKHIVFEPAFKVGHVNKPSYGDILVFDKEYKPLVLIENKTYGGEFSHEWNNMQKDGGQLFSYLGPLVNELGFCENLVLFAADFEDKLILKNHIITLKDNKKRIDELNNPKTFSNAQGKYFDVWSETYAKSFETKGLFEKDIAAYSIGKLKYTVADLKELSHAEIRPIYHEFATILRNHAITDFEHSFYILIDLFLCKITDERNNPEDLQFYYKGITRDTPKEYCNRLLKLYQEGKKQLFNVDVVNKEESDIKQIFEDTNRSVTNGLFAGIKELFEEIKFYNIKKFNFIDVENKEDFEKNFQILIKIAALIQDINLSNSETNHFFGDLFEGLLSKNVHQTEGQFFTPLPIVNFIIKCLPEFPNSENVKVLDYACGAGHFLTEFIKSYPAAKAYGIEKSQTLSQVAKIATIINGSKDARIVFKDSLSILNTQEVRFQGFDNESFDCIIANPPYSVKGFLNTLTDNDRKQFSLTDSIEEKAYGANNSIECFFIERTKHFLRSNGLVGIVLPSSILSNGNLYIKTRELLFANFNILAIVNLNSRTFGSTGTNTIVLFAQRVKNKNSHGLLETFEAKKDYTQYTTYQAINNYIQKQGYDKSSYFKFMQDEELSETLKQHEIFADYKLKFKSSPIKKPIQMEWFKTSSFFDDKEKENSKAFKKLFDDFCKSDEYKTLAEEEQERQFISFAKKIEHDKLNTFIQIESNQVAILQSPPDKVGNKSNKAQIVKFLGYDWSNRKGDEGIKYETTHKENNEDIADSDESDVEIATAINSIKYIDTPLYNPNDAWDNSKFAFAIRKHIYNQCRKFSFGENKEEIKSDFNGEMGDLLSFANLSDMVDFTRTEFDKAIKLTADKKIEIKSKYPLVTLGDYANMKGGDTFKEIYQGNQNATDIPFFKVGDMNTIGNEFSMIISNNYVDEETLKNKIKATIFSENTIVFPKVGMAIHTNKKRILGRNAAVDNNTMALWSKNEEILSYKYLYYYFLSEVDLSSVASNSNPPSISISNLSTQKIPLPPLDIQAQIVSECEKVDEEYNNNQINIEKYRKEIAEVFDELDNKATKDIRLSNTSLFDISIGRRILNSEVNQKYNIPVYSANVFEPFGMIDKLLIEDFSVDSVIWGIDGDWMVNVIPANHPFYPTDHCGVLRIKANDILPKYMAHLLEEEGKKVGFKRSYRASIDRIESLSVKIAPIEQQHNAISKIESYEAKIAKAKAVMEGCAERKKQILEKYLQ